MSDSVPERIVIPETISLTETRRLTLVRAGLLKPEWTRPVTDAGGRRSGQWRTSGAASRMHP